MDEIRFILGLLAPYKRRYFTALLLIALITPVNVVNNFLIKTIIDDVIGKHQIQLLAGILTLFYSLTVVRVVGWYYAHYAIEQVSQRIMFFLRSEGYKKILGMDFSFFDRHRTGDLMTRMTADIELVRHFLAHVMFTVVENSVLFIGALIVMFTMADISFVVMVLMLIPIIVALAFRMSKEVHPCFAKIREMRSALNTVVQENIGANRVVKAFVREDFENEKLSEANENYKVANFDANKVWRKYMPFMSNAQMLIVFYNIVVGGMLVIAEKLSLGELIMFNNMAWVITTPLSMVGWIVNDTSNCAASIAKLRELLSEEPEISNPKPAVDTRLEGSFEFERVSFAYDNMTQGALVDVSFSVRKGQKIAIVGPTGSGKSTVISLLGRFYDAQKGRLLVDGIDIRDYDLETLRSNIAVAQQDVFLFSETVAANIAYGKANATMEEIIAAAKAACAHEFIQQLPQGYNTIIGERGVGLSGGQKQRLTLARALLKNPSVLILDDTTSSLDARTENDIQEKLRECFHEKTVFIISQRIASVKDCDKIIVLSDGRISEIGSHEQLLRQKKYYYNIYIQQYAFGSEEG